MPYFCSLSSRRPPALVRALYGAVIALVLVCAAPPARSQGLVTKSVEYREGDTVLEGYLAYEPGRAPLPGVLIVHQWKGLGIYEKQRAQMLARLGYVAFAADIYGKGVRPTTAAEAGAQASKYRVDRALLRRRAAAGLAQLKAFPFVDAKRVAAIGYCFGGGTVLELARSGADLRAAVSFHGNLDTPNLADAKNIKAKILVCHGALDPHVTQASVQTFQNEMTAASVDWQLIQYSGAVHAFTDWTGSRDNSTGAAYNRAADKRSWAAMLQFFHETLAATPSP